MDGSTLEAPDSEPLARKPESLTINETRHQSVKSLISYDRFTTVQYQASCPESKLDRVTFVEDYSIQLRLTVPPVLLCSLSPAVSMPESCCDCSDSLEKHNPGYLCKQVLSQLITN